MKLKYRFETRYYPMKDQWYIYLTDLTGGVLASKAIKDGFDEEEVTREGCALAKEFDSQSSM